jgi:hypothetical protein
MGTKSKARDGNTQMWQQNTTPKREMYKIEQHHGAKSTGATAGQQKYRQQRGKQSSAW